MNCGWHWTLTRILGGNTINLLCECRGLPLYVLFASLDTALNQILAPYSSGTQHSAPAVCKYLVCFFMQRPTTKKICEDHALTHRRPHPEPDSRSEPRRGPLQSGPLYLARTSIPWCPPCIRPSDCTGDIGRGAGGYTRFKENTRCAAGYCGTVEEGDCPAA